MRQHTFETTLRHSPEDVWAFLSDLSNDCAWREEVTMTRLVSGEPGVTGSVYEENLKWQGMRATASLVLTESVKGEALTVRLRDPRYESVSEYRFTPSDSGTRLTLAFSMEGKGVPRPVEPFVWAMGVRWLERDLQGLDGAMDAVVNCGSPDR